MATTATRDFKTEMKAAIAKNDGALWARLKRESIEVEVDAKPLSELIHTPAPLIVGQREVPVSDEIKAQYPDADTKTVYETVAWSDKYWMLTDDFTRGPKWGVYDTANGKVAAVFIPKTAEVEIDNMVAETIERSGQFALPANILPYGQKPGRLFKSKQAPAVLADGSVAEVREVVEPVVDKDLFTLPNSALTSSRLGDIYDKLFAPNDWPMELALPALVTAASVVVPRMPRPEDGSMPLSDDPMTTLYTALIAPVNAGKSQLNDWAAKALGIYRELRGTYYYKLKSGSAEQFFKNLNKYETSFAGAVLVNPDEWSHLLGKASIKDSSFASNLTSMFYSRDNTITVGGQGGGKEISLRTAVSITGGIVQEDFGMVFGAESLGGLYDRLLFGLAPEGFKWSYRDYPDTVIPFEAKDWRPVPVRADGSVAEVIKHWNKANREWGRIVEVCTRVAMIFASLDGRKTITGRDLEALYPLAKYQMDIRSIYKPNAGLNHDALFANAAEDWINKHAHQWKPLRDLKRGVNAYEATLGPNVAERSLYALARAGRIELWISQVDRGGNLNAVPSDYGTKGRRPTGLVRRVRGEE